MNSPHQVFRRRYLPGFVTGTSAAVIILAMLLAALLLSWLSVRDHILEQLENNTRILQNNVQFALQQAELRLTPLAESARRAQSTGDEWLTRHRPPRQQYSHLALLDAGGHWLASTLEQPLSAVPAAEMQQLHSAMTTRMLAPVEVQGGHYLPFCHPLYTGSSLCLLSSTSDDSLQWPVLLGNQPVTYRILRNDGTLLLASRLGIHYQYVLGQPLSAPLQNAFGLHTPNAQTRFFYLQELDDGRYMGISRHDDATGLVYVLSVPMSYMFRSWLSDILRGFPLWLLAAGGGWYLYWLARTRISVQPSEAATESTEHLQLACHIMDHIQGAMYQIHLPEHRLLQLTRGQSDIIPADWADAPQSHSLLSLIHPQDQEAYLQQLEQKTAAGESYELVYRITTGPDPDDHSWLLDRGHTVSRDAQGILIEGLLIDITDHILAEQHVEYLATRDPLTELMNRYYFNDELISALSRMKQNSGSLALLFIDLDRFKTINESLGHQLGDRLLKLVAERLRHVVSPGDMIARLGGDEFIVMMVNPDSPDSIEQLAKDIIGHLNQTFQLDYYRLTTSCSIGITRSPEDSVESYILLRNADTAMYHAKARGGNCYQFFTEEMNREVNSRLTLENELRRAISNGEFELYYQPQVSATDNTLFGAEALIRWEHPTAGLVSPADFIPVAEETGLIREIGDWALLEACRAFRRINEEFDSGLTVSVNVSVRQLNDAFVQRVGDILEQTGLPACFLELEITESLLMDNVQENIRLLDAINQLGVRFAMDDFGTGYSSLSYLRQFPISKLKIDQAFIHDITSDPEDEAIVHAIIAMAKSLDLELVAEGVETREQLSLLQALHCDCYQGYYFSKPVPLNQFRRTVIAAFPRQTSPFPHKQP